MKKVAKLVAVSFLTRVIVNDTDTDEEILNKAKSKFHTKVNSELSENLEYIQDDTECPVDKEELDEIFKRRLVTLAKYGIVESTDENGDYQVQKIDDVIAFREEHGLNFTPAKLSSDKEAKMTFDCLLAKYIDMKDNAY